MYGTSSDLVMWEACQGRRGEGEKINKWDTSVTKNMVQVRCHIHHPGNRGTISSQPWQNLS
jgi:hypothetical protein